MNVINHLQHLAWENYDLINEESDLQSWVINLRLLHTTTKKEAKVMNKVVKKLHKILENRDVCQEKSNEVQIRIPKTKLKKVYNTLNKIFKKTEVTYQMVIVNHIKNSKKPVGKTMCDGLVEAGQLRDSCQKERLGSYCLFYDRKTRIKAWIKGL